MEQQSELKQAYAQIEALLVECEKKQKDIAHHEIVAIAGLVKGELDAKGFVSAIEQQKELEVSMMLREKACYRALYLVNEYSKDAK